MMQVEDKFKCPGVADTRSKRANREKVFDSKDGLFPFICGLCYGSYNQIVVFYKHFKEHSDHIGDDIFHSCDLQEPELLKRDSCEQTDDITAFNCNKCSVTMPTICSLHEHLQEHEPKGSYTLDIQTSTGYPSPKPFPYIKLNQFSDNDVHLLPANHFKKQTRKTKNVTEINKPEFEQTNEKDESKTEFIANKDTESSEESSEEDGNGLEDMAVDDTEYEDPEVTEENADFEDSVDDEDETVSDINVQSKKKKNRKDGTGIVTVYSGRKKFLQCDVCGVRKEQYLLAKHVEKQHTGIELSIKFVKALEDLKGKVQHRKFIKRIKNETEMPIDDENLASSDESKLEEQVLFQTRKKLFMKCKYCGILVQKSRIEKHEKFHRTRAGRLMYSQKNLAKCDKCVRVVLKSNIHKHKCVEMTVRPLVKTVETEELDDGEKKNVAKKGKKKYVYLEKLPCHVCGVLIKRHSLKKHLMGHTDAKPYKCDKCDKCFKYSESCKKHVQDVHGERQYHCDQCPKAFTTSSMMKDHYKIHTDERPYPCPQCGRRFRRKSQMSSHAYTHGGEPNHPCVECGKKFMRQTNLTEHVKAIHMKIRNWVCSWPECAKPFGSSTTLRRHMLIHTGEKPVKCGHCEAAFTQRTELKLHLQRKHNIDKLPPPTASNPYAGVPHCVIQQTEACPEDEGNQPMKTLKTVMFSSVMTNISNLYSPSEVKNTDNVKLDMQIQTHPISGAQNLTGETNPVIQQQYVGNLKVEPGTSGTFDAGVSVTADTGISVIVGTSSSDNTGISTAAGTSTSDYVGSIFCDNASTDIRVIASTSSSYNASIDTSAATDTSNIGIADTSTNAFVIIDTSDIAGIGTGFSTDTNATVDIRSRDAVAGSSEVDSSIPVYNAMQGTSLLPIREEVDDKSQLVPSHSEYQYDYITDSSTLTTMTPVIPNAVEPQ